MSADAVHRNRWVWLSVVLMSACSSSAAPVSLSPEWPSQHGKYGDTQRAWTRSATLRSGYDEVLRVYATLKSPAWRAAYVDRQARLGKLTDAQRAALIDEHKTAIGGAYEVHLIVTTHNHRENDLHRGKKSIWRLVLVDDRGTVIEPESIVRDRRPVSVVRAEYPDMGDFSVAYIARFPHTAELLRPDATQVTLEMSSPRGAVSLRWTSEAANK